MRRTGAVVSARDRADQVQEAASGETSMPGVVDSDSVIEGSGALTATAHFRAIAKWVAAFDVLCLVGALVSAWFLRFGLTQMPSDYLWLIAASPPVWLIVFHGFGLYHPQHLAPEEEFRRVVIAVSIGILFLVLVSFWSKSSFARGWIALAWILALLFELVIRRGWRGYITEQRASGTLALRTLIVGGNEEAQQIVEAVNTPESGFAPVGFIAPTPQPLGDLRYLGDGRDLEDLINRERIECIFVAPSGVDPVEMAVIVTVARQTGTDVRVRAGLPELLTSRMTVGSIGGVVTLSLRAPRLTRLQEVTKRAFDLVVATAILVVTLPVLLVVALLVRITSRGPVFFKQERVTKGGHTFSMIKFRTMRHDADAVLEELGIDPSQPFFKLGREDPRITPVGRVLRRWSLDELPQLFNVLRGEMSLVGPRPLPSDQVAANLELLEARHEVPPGITGWWQVRGRSGLDTMEAIRMDLFYIENWSLLLDLYILLKTAGAVLSRRGAT